MGTKYRPFQVMTMRYKIKSTFSSIVSGKQPFSMLKLLLSAQMEPLQAWLTPTGGQLPLTKLRKLIEGHQQNMTKILFSSLTKVYKTPQRTWTSNLNLWLLTRRNSKLRRDLRCYRAKSFTKKLSQLRLGANLIIQMKMTSGWPKTPSFPLRSSNSNKILAIPFEWYLSTVDT